MVRPEGGVRDGLASSLAGNFGADTEGLCRITKGALNRRQGRKLTDINSRLQKRTQTVPHFGRGGT